jgi:hypothetical protein
MVNLRKDDNGSIIDIWKSGHFLYLLFHVQRALENIHSQADNCG